MTYFNLLSYSFPEKTEENTKRLSQQTPGIQAEIRTENLKN